MENKMSKKGNLGLGAVLIAVVELIVGLLLFPVVKSAVNDSLDGSSSDSVVAIIPVLYGILILSIIVVTLVVAYKRAK